MSDNIATAIDAISNEHPNEFKDAISRELLARLSSRIDMERTQVASKLFGTSTEEEPSDEN
jgi:hypothetical protein